MTEGIFTRTSANEKGRMTAKESVRPVNDEANRYSRRNVLRSEAMYGHGFQSPGGLEAVEEFCRKLQMRRGMKILEIGSGLGGNTFYLAQQYAATVVGLDISKEMFEIANERKKVLGLSTVSFQQGDIRTAPLEKHSFDLAWTRDCILYIEEKSVVWKNIHAALKEGGQLFVTDFCKGKAPLSEEFTSYLDHCRYHLEELDAYVQSLKAGGSSRSAWRTLQTSSSNHLKRSSHIWKRAVRSFSMSLTWRIMTIS